MVVHLYGNDMSTCTKRVAVTLHEKQIPFQFHPIDFAKAEHKLPDYVAKQPFGQVPYIEDDGLVVYQSRAIGRYLALKYASQGTPLIPPTSDITKTVAFEEAMQIENQEFEPSASKIGIEKLIFPTLVPGYQPDEQAVKAAVNTLGKKLDVYEKILSKQKFLAGDEITLADLNHIPWGINLKVCGVDVPEERPAVSRWWNDVVSRPSVIAFQDGFHSIEKY
ncbi:glutathione S-transferase [Cylindrobasidium torrendii FP15055 ss-10]|uniref:glutathione transferase n=1 Tax=Cylindrobasidium torrendii FP15055 ss-10 TaxID=1314674 RepID=A0A0D7AUB0_9AGAR|nr:glutathione S-transferase [Cylindrobasidium torrendii FP15055 ss-10]